MMKLFSKSHSFIFQHKKFSFEKRLFLLFFLIQTPKLSPPAVRSILSSFSCVIGFIHVRTLFQFNRSQFDLVECNLALFPFILLQFKLMGN